MAIDRRQLLRGIGGTACASAGIVATAALAGVFSSYSPVVATGSGATAANGVGTSVTAVRAQSTGLGAGNNRGDVWVDNLPAHTDPGHETDPQLACADVGIWGDKLVDSSGPFTIQGWPPSGSMETDFSGVWNYDTSTGGPQLIASIPVDTLMANAVANGDTASNHGWHFKVDLEDPRAGGSVGDDKYKTFWLSCAGGVGGATPTPTPTETATSTPTPPPTETPTPTPTPTPTETATATPTPTPTSSVGGATPTPTPTATPTSEVSPTSGVGGITATPTPTVSSGVQALVTTPNTGAGLPLGAAGGLMALGLSLLGIARRIKPRS